MIKLVNQRIVFQVWSLATYEQVFSICAHKESVLGLFLSEDKNILFSSGGDSVINVSRTFHIVDSVLTLQKIWSPRTFERYYSIYSHHDVGDIFAVAYSADLSTLYCGAQNTSIQVCPNCTQIS